MILQIFCVKDRATNLYGTPMFMVATGQAVRSFTDEVNRVDRENQLYQHPDDFDLYTLGQFDNESGKFDVSDPLIVCRGKDVAERPATPNLRSVN